MPARLTMPQLCWECVKLHSVFTSICRCWGWRCVFVPSDLPSLLGWSRTGVPIHLVQTQTATLHSPHNVLLWSLTKTPLGWSGKAECTPHPAYIRTLSIRCLASPSPHPDTWSTSHAVHGLSCFPKLQQVLAGPCFGFLRLWAIIPVASEPLSVHIDPTFVFRLSASFHQLSWISQKFSLK